MHENRCVHHLVTFHRNNSWNMETLFYFYTREPIQTTTTTKVNDCEYGMMRERQNVTATPLNDIFFFQENKKKKWKSDDVNALFGGWWCRARKCRFFLASIFLISLLFANVYKKATPCIKCLQFTWDHFECSFQLWLSLLNFDEQIECKFNFLTSNNLFSVNRIVIGDYF